ncbi:MAG: hypothetical protein WCK67_08300 [bacterium]
MLKNIIKFCLVIAVFFTMSFASQAESYPDGCLKLYSSFIVNNNPQLTNYIKKMCSCQQEELIKAGVSQSDLDAFVKNAGIGKLDNETIKVAPHINALIDSKTITKKCGSLF